MENRLKEKFNDYGTGFAYFTSLQWIKKTSLFSDVFWILWEEFLQRRKLFAKP